MAKRGGPRTPAWSLAVLLLATTAAARPDGLSVRYFAFGSNMASSVMVGRRGMRPLEPPSAALVRGHELGFTLPGVPLVEPAFASLERSSDAEAACHGVLYTLSLGDWARLCASEGVPTGAYRIVTVPAERYDDGAVVSAYSLTAGLLRSPVSLSPSERYLKLLQQGALEVGLRDEYQQMLREIETSPFSRRPT